MKRERFDMSILILCLVLLSGLTYLLTLQGGITGFATYDTAQAGNVAELNLSIFQSSGYWQAYFGEIIINSSLNQTPYTAAQQGNAGEFNISLPCVGDEIYAGTSDNLTLQGLVAGDKTDVDDFLGLNSSHVESGSQVFQNTSSLVFSANIINVPTTYMKVADNPNSESFDLGLLNESEELVFASHVSLDTIGFDNKTHDYQMMVPVNQSSLTYYFYSDCAVNCSSAPSSFVGSLNADNESVDLSWSTITTADSYNIYYSTNISAIMTMDPDKLVSDITTVNINDINWTDFNASDVQKRYYRVGSVTNGCVNLTDTTAKFTYYHTAPPSNVFGTLASNWISVYLNVNFTAESFLENIPNSLNPTIGRPDKSNTSGEFFTVHVKGLAGNDFAIEQKIGYKVTVDQPFNQTIVGKVAPPSYELSYSAPISSIYGTLASNFRGIYDFNRVLTASTFLETPSSSLNPTIGRLDKSNASGEFFTMHVKGLVGNNFNLDLGIGYKITIDGDFNHTLCTDCFG